MRFVTASAMELHIALEQLARSCSHVMSIDINAHPHGTVAVIQDAKTMEYKVTQCFLADPDE